MALIEQNLNEQTSKNVAKCIKMFAVKTEQQLETGPEAAQVIGRFFFLGNMSLFYDSFHFSGLPEYGPTEEREPRQRSVLHPDANPEDAFQYEGKLAGFLRENRWRELARSRQFNFQHSTTISW